MRALAGLAGAAGPAKKTADKSAPDKSGKSLFCIHEELAVNLAKLSNKDLGDIPGLEGMHPSVYLREAVFQKLCFLAVPVSGESRGTVYRGPENIGFSVVRGEAVSAKGKRLNEFFLVPAKKLPRINSR